ncbi:MAG: DUF4058 family protein [Roseiflexaceae bacterium]
MQPPFPGMDPYLEQPSMWPDVHSSLIYAIRDQIQAQLSPRYTAVITPYVAFESLEIAPVRLAAVPDIGLLERDVLDTGGAAVAIEAAPLTLPAIMEVPTRYARLEIRTVGDEVLVTAIELLSPANKRPGAEGADAYEKKRQELFRSEAHLLEIDLLRGGRRSQTARPLPDNPYFVLLSRAERRPRLEIWPLSLRMAIKRVPVPLRRPDPDVALDLTAALRQIYASARYERRINYQEAPPPPDLSPEDAAWLDAHLRERGLRS